MEINVSVQYNEGLLPDIILLIRCGYIGEPFRYHEEVLSLQAMFPPKPLDTFSPEGGSSEGLDLCVCVCAFSSHSGHQVRWTYQPGSHRRKVTQEEGHTGFSSTFLLRCVP